jgi:DNA-binding NarL/FixJ family response regulator
MISAYIIDDFTLFREGIKEILKTYDSIYIAGDNTKKIFIPKKLKLLNPI